MNGVLCVTAHGTRDESWWQFPAPECGSYLKRVGRLSAQDISLALMWLFAEKVIVFSQKTVCFNCFLMQLFPVATGGTEDGWRCAWAVVSHRRAAVWVQGGLALTVTVL